MRLRSLALTVSLALTLPLATMTAPAAAAPKLTVTSTTLVPGLFGGMFGSVISAEAPDGTVYVVTTIAGVRTLWASVAHEVATELVSNIGLGTTVAMAADATNVYVGSPVGIHAYNRVTGALTQHWVLSPSPRALSQIVVAGNRVWALLTHAGIDSRPNSMVELDPASPIRVRTLDNVYDTYSIAAASSAIYYLTGPHDTLVRLTNAGVKTNAPSHVDLSHEVEGPAGALQAYAISGNTLIVQESPREGDELSMLPYNATTLAGPGKSTVISDTVTVSPTALGLLEVSNSADLACSLPSARVCVRRLALQGVGLHGPALVLPDVATDRVLGPHPAIVAYDVHNKMHVVRIG